MKILMLVSLLFGFAAFAQDAVQPTPTDAGKATQPAAEDVGSATVPGTPSQEKQLEENKAVHDHKAKAHHAKAHAKAHGKKVAKKAKKKKHKKTT